MDKLKWDPRFLLTPSLFLGGMAIFSRPDLNKTCDQFKKCKLLGPPIVK